MKFVCLLFVRLACLSVLERSGIGWQKRGWGHASGPPMRDLGAALEATKDDGGDIVQDNHDGRGLYKMNQFQYSAVHTSEALEGLCTAMGERYEVTDRGTPDAAYVPRGAAGVSRYADLKASQLERLLRKRKLKTSGRRADARRCFSLSLSLSLSGEKRQDG
eukprot:TRINITY_DN7593_c0_g1_i1.p2 TRINITY_DN7593_c0_g1~~TRINITY_DN7593_c0_g1_i1.p2  ORF type:complete len:162 (+),score=27.44 TRINITY_DN7593_c0_g1_i1:61-546(+)